jgi:hypothetical protein
MSDAVPPDLEQVREAFRLGWLVSELRGRCRLDSLDHPLPRAIEEQIPPRLPHALPLATERKPGEVRIELSGGARQLSKALGLDPKKLELVSKARKALEKPRAGANKKALWTALADAFYDWDAFIQDTLLLQATQAAAYQLGRGLADTYWALEPGDATDGMTSCRFLLGPERHETLHRLTLRLSAYLGPLTVAAVTGSLASWRKYVKSLLEHRALDEGATLQLYRQGLLWRDLIRGERLPKDLVDDPMTPSPSARQAWRDATPYWDVLKTLWLPILGGVISAAGLAAGAAFLASGTTSPGFSTAISVIGGLGLTSATLYGRAKAEIVSLFGTFSAAVEAKKVARAADLTPKAATGS